MEEYERKCKCGHEEYVHVTVESVKGCGTCCYDYLIDNRKGPNAINTGLHIFEESFSSVLERTRQYDSETRKDL